MQEHDNQSVLSNKVDDYKQKTSNSEITKMTNACVHGPEIAKTVSENEILNVPQSLSKSFNTMYHCPISELTKRFSKYSKKCREICYHY